MKKVIGFIADHPTPKIHEGGGIAFTLNSRDYKGVMVLVLSDIRTVGNGDGTGERRNHEGGCPTWNANHEQPILMSGRKGHNGISTDGIGTTLTAQEKDRPVIGDTVVRRLTPLECERLQGFPDGWTDIGDWVDSKGKKHKDADSPRYKAIGNSLAVPFWFWLLRRISAQYERPATLGSLFDGIGGFPLCWERCNGKGTALWASEIEEFPIAVTKRRFPEEEP